MAGKIEKKKAAKKSNAISRFVRETVGELRKVSWPSRQEAINLTIIVLIVMVVTSIFLYTVDIIGARLLTLAVGL
ncbi:MAG: preprotein translocase subunit SecE [Chloroflexota bacterium]